MNDPDNIRMLLTSLSDIARLCYWFKNAAGDHYVTSDNGPELLGWPEGMTRIPIEDFHARIHDDDRPRIVAQREAALREGKPIEISYRFWHATQQRWIFLRSLHFYEPGPDGEPITRYGITQDITRQKEAEAELAKERQRIESAQTLGRMGTWSFDIKARVGRVSRSVLRMLGTEALTDATMSEEESLDNVHPNDKQRVLDAMTRCIRTGEPFELEYRRWHHTEQRWVDLRGAGHVVRDAEGQPQEIQGFTQDITRQKENEQRLQVAASVFDHSRNLIVITDTERRILQANPAFCALSGFTVEEAIGRRPEELIMARIPISLRGKSWLLRLRGSHWSGELHCRRKDGEFFLLAANISAVRNEKGKISHFIGVGSDVTQEKAAARQINHLAYHDSLTQLPNRIRFRQQVDQAMEQAAREGRQLALLFLDLDYFKNVNDSLGHSAGDQLLIEVASRLRIAVRASDTVGRLGGDEFMVLLPFGGAEAARNVADKLIAALAQPFWVENMALTITSSIGIGIYPRDGDTYDALLRAADAAMFKAKEAGRNTFLDFTPEMNGEVRRRLELVNELRQALPRGELQLYYQPQVDLRDGRLLGAEALLRWHHPVWGTVSPAEFIPVAEEAGLIETIGAWVIEEACRQAMAWDHQGLPRLCMAVNCSARQFLNPHPLLDTVRNALEGSGLEPARLELEITESLIVEDIAKTQWLLQQLRSLGVHIAVDDFGTGYSSLYYLKRLPIDKLKIDQSFIRELVCNPDDRTIAAAVVALGQSLCLKVIAEGVETDEQRELLETMGCNEGQGYYWGRPMPAGEFAARYGPGRPGVTKYQAKVPIR